MKAKNRIEVFSAGCPLCNETLTLVKNSVGACGCEVSERRCAGAECCAEARAYGVKAMPTLIVNGQIVFEGRINAAQAAPLAK